MRACTVVIAVAAACAAFAVARSDAPGLAYLIVVRENHPQRPQLQ